MAFLPVLLLVWLPLVVKAQLNAGDTSALRALQTWLHDVPGSNSESFFATWDFSTDPCSFQGVLCDMVEGEERVVSLNMGMARGSSFGMYGRLHPEVGSLSALVQLTLAPGKVGGPIPDSIARLTNLQNMGLSHNLLTGPIPSSLGSMLRLLSLDLSYNRLSGSPPASLASLPNLQLISLAHNRLTGSLPAFTSPRLTHLDMQRNAIGGQLPPLPGSLTYVSLSRNHLTGPISTLAPLHDLTFLDLSRNQFSGDVPPELFLAPLTSLLLQRNELSGPMSPPGLVVIPTVDLSLNQLSGPLSPFLAFVQNLYLNNNLFVGAVPQEFIDQLMASSLQTLFLQDNFLTGFPLEAGVALPMTASLCIQYNCMTPPIQAFCPQSAGTELSRPSSQCRAT